MIFYIIPAFVALMLKLSVMYFARRGDHASRVFIAMVLIFALHNLSEILVIVKFFEGNISELLLKSYYAIAIFALSYFCLYAVEVSSKKLNPKVYISVLTFSLAFAIVLFSTDYIVIGAESIEYTVTAIRGQYYAAFQIFAVAAILFSVTTLVNGYLQARDQLHQIQCIYTIAAFLPIVVAVTAVLIVMQLGYNVSGALILPLATTGFLILSLRSEHKHGLTDIGRFFNPSQKRATANMVATLTEQCLGDEVSLKEAKDNFEKYLLQHKLDKFGNNVSKTARVLNMKRTTIYSMVKKHGISVDNKS